LKILIMNNLFKYEFEKLNPNEIKEIINRCAGCDILEINAIGNATKINHLKLVNIAKFCQLTTNGSEEGSQSPWCLVKKPRRSI